MSSFINLMASERWSEADIVNRTEAMIAGEFPPAAVAILNRKATGAALGQYQLSAEEAAEIARYAQVSEAARQAGIAARADMLLLTEVLAVEAAQRRLERPAVQAATKGKPPAVSNQAEVDADAAERAAAQAVVDGASVAALDLVALRNPAPVEPEPEVQP